VDRRAFVGTVALSLLAPRLAAEAQVGKVYRIGWLSNTPSSPYDPVREAFARAMRQEGWVEGQNFILDRRYAEGRNERFPGLAAELVQGKPDLLVTVGTPATAAAKGATATIPIVFIAVGDPVGSGLVASLARPGGNVTGQGGLGPEMHGKMLELLKEAVPKASRMAVFVNSGFPLHALYRNAIEPVARSLNVALKSFEVRAPEELDGAFATVAREKFDALIILAQPMMSGLRGRVAKLALEHQMPAIANWSEAVEAGVLMSYGSRAIDELRRLPYFIDRILKGAKPADLPVEQSTTFYISINLKTAKALGLTIPQSLLLRADQVIE
jgi:putative tryptophan/tyrosine transport system substrate-binding protein